MTDDNRHCLTCKHEPDTWAINDPLTQSRVGLCRNPAFRTRPKKERDIEVLWRGNRCYYAGQGIKDCRGWEPDAFHKGIKDCQGWEPESGE